MAADGGHLGWRFGSLDIILKDDHLCHVCFKLAYWFQRTNCFKHFPIGSYVKTMSADGGHLGWRSGSEDIILKAINNFSSLFLDFSKNIRIK